MTVGQVGNSGNTGHHFLNNQIGKMGKHTAFQISREDREWNKALKEAKITAKVALILLAVMVSVVALACLLPKAINWVKTGIENRTKETNRMLREKSESINKILRDLDDLSKKIQNQGEAIKKRKEFWGNTQQLETDLQKLYSEWDQKVSEFHKLEPKSFHKQNFQTIQEKKETMRKAFENPNQVEVPQSPGFAAPTNPVNLIAEKEINPLKDTIKELLEKRGGAVNRSQQIEVEKKLKELGIPEDFLTKESKYRQLQKKVARLEKEHSEIGNALDMQQRKQNYSRAGYVRGLTDLVNIDIRDAKKESKKNIKNELKNIETLKQELEEIKAKTAILTDVEL